MSSAEIVVQSNVNISDLLNFNPLSNEPNAIKGVKMKMEKGRISTEIAIMMPIPNIFSCLDFLCNSKRVSGICKRYIRQMRTSP